MLWWDVRKESDGTTVLNRQGVQKANSRMEQLYRSFQCILPALLCLAQRFFRVNLFDLFVTFPSMAEP